MTPASGVPVGDYPVHRRRPHRPPRPHGLTGMFALRSRADLPVGARASRGGARPPVVKHDASNRSTYWAWRPMGAHRTDGARDEGEHPVELLGIHTEQVCPDAVTGELTRSYPAVDGLAAHADRGHPSRRRLRSPSVTSEAPAF